MIFIFLLPVEGVYFYVYFVDYCCYTSTVFMYALVWVTFCAVAPLYKCQCILLRVRYDLRRMNDILHVLEVETRSAGECWKTLFFL